MTYFRLMDLKVHLVFIWLSVNYITAETNDTSTTPLRKVYVANYVEIKAPNNSLKLDTKTKVANFIKDKIQKLKPYLQDEVITDNDKLTLDGEEETTIIEFSPQMRSILKDFEAKQRAAKANEFRKHIEKYKMLRNRIKKKLKNEKVNDKTRKLVTSTLDEMIAQMIANQCWRNGVQNKQSAPVKTAARTMWEPLWEKIKKEYSELGLGMNTHENFMKKFRELMTVMSNDLSTLVDKHKVVCQFTASDDDKNKANVLRNQKKPEANNLKTVAEKQLQGHDMEEKIPCTDFKVCSDELYEFMYDLYVKMNETTVNTVSDYAAMFVLDVGNDSYQEKQRVVGLINNIVKDIAGRVPEVFKKQTEKFKLDPKKNKYSNVRYLYKYITKNIEHVKKSLHESVANNLESVREKLMLIIQKDIDVNVNVELGNLEREVGGNICPAFELCNGKYLGVTRRNYVGNRRVYVELKLDVNINNHDTTTLENSQSKDNTYRMVTPLNMSVTRTAKLNLSLKQKQVQAIDKYLNKPPKLYMTKLRSNTLKMDRLPWTMLDTAATQKNDLIIKNKPLIIDKITEQAMIITRKQKPITQLTTKIIQVIISSRKQKPISNELAKTNVKTTKTRTTSRKVTTKRTPYLKKGDKALRDKNAVSSVESISDILKDLLNENDAENEVVNKYYKKRDVKN